MAFRPQTLFLICTFAAFTSVPVLAQSGLNFSSPVGYGSGGNGGNSIAVADLNGDGKPDLVVADWCATSACTSGNVAVLLGNGDGTFQTAVSYGSGGLYADWVVVADLRGNGNLDLIVANCGSVLNNICVGTNGGVGVLLGNGDGTFQPPVSYAQTFGVAAVAAADVDADGKLDLLIATNCGSGKSYTGCVGVLSGKGDGTFAIPLTYSSGGYSPNAIAVGDVNGDGKPDLVVAHCGTVASCGAGNVGVLLGNGDGTFAGAVAYGSAGLYPDGVAIADVNGDGKADVVVANSSTSPSVNAGDLGVLLGKGDGTFQAAVAYPSGGYGAASVAVVDVNGDGKLDMVVANCSSISGSCSGSSGTVGVGVLLGNGDGTFQTVITYGSGGNTPFGLAVADLNGDTKPDIVVANCGSGNCGAQPGRVGVLMNASLGGTTTKLASSANPSTFGQSVTFSATVTSGFKGTPTGTVNLFDGTRNIATSSLDSSSVATLTTASLAVGTHSITATYSGDGNFWTSTSSVLSQVVQGAIAQILPTSLAFGNQTVGISSTSQSVTVTNNGNIPLTIATLVVGTNASDFSQTNTCGPSVAAGDSCTIGVTFTPAATGTRTAAVRITDNAPNSPQSVLLGGVGVTPKVQLSTKSLTFPTQVVLTTSKAGNVTLSNTGLGILNFTNIAVTGSFGQTNTCGMSLNPGGSCAFSVTFSPTTIGTLTGSISITDNAPNSPQNISLKGTGTSIQLTPTGVNFGNQGVGTKSLTKKITVSNKGSVAVSITSITITGTNASDFAESNNCGTSVASGATCSIGVTFTPSATGGRLASVSVGDNGGGSPQQVRLKGAGI
jgi:hypothetical protein